MSPADRGTDGPARPPRLARWLLQRALPAPLRESVLGDIQEVYSAHRQGLGALRAGVWYWAQAVSFAARFLVERVADGIAALGGGLVPSWIDVKLGSRMLIKSPLLTITGCVAIATAIGINAGFNEFIGDMTSMVMRVPGERRVVRVVNRDLASGRLDGRLLEDLSRWREELVTVEQLGAALSHELNLVVTDGPSIPVDVTEMSASGFEVTGMVPELGRPLLDADDGPGAEPVMVLGYDLWRRHLQSNPSLVGSTVRLGGTVYTVVGVAPEGFHFPARREVWVNFRRDPRDFAPRMGPGVIVFGRLAEGRSLTEASAELDALGRRASTEYPDTHESLRPEVVRFGELMGLAGSDQMRWALRAARAFFVMILIIACANIATLVFARNAGRETEIAVRTALGAGRGRIVTQLFAEALVLAVLATGVGLVVADGAIRWGSDIFWRVQRTEAPFWWDPGLSTSTVLYSFALAVLGAAVVGVFPALRATRRDLAPTLQRAASGGSALSFGALPTAVIVIQIAISVAFIPIVLMDAVSDLREKAVSISFETEQYLTARLLLDSEVQAAAAAEDRANGDRGVRYISVAGVGDRIRTGPALLSRYSEMVDLVGRRLRSEPGVRNVAFTTRLPGLFGQSIPSTRLEIESLPRRNGGWFVMTATVGIEHFDIIGRRMADGRRFTQVDYAPDQRVAIVNQAFVREIFGGRSPVGHLVRDYMREGDPSRLWTEIVGVLPDEVTGPSGKRAQIYYPLSGDGDYPVRVVMHVDGDPLAFAPRLRQITAEADPGIILDEIYPLETIRRDEALAELFFVLVLLFVAIVTSLLATAGVYSLMSFIVSQRTREIGIRTALGAHPTRVMTGVFSRVFFQLGLGVALGFAIIGLPLGRNLAGGLTPELMLAGGGVSAVLIAVGLIGCAIPMIRALRIQPTQALRADG